MTFYPVLRGSVPSNGRKIDAIEFSRLSIRGIGVKRAAAIGIRSNGTMFVLDTAGRKHSVGRAA